MTKLLQKEVPTSDWITKDTNKDFLNPSIAVTIPLTTNDENDMKRMIDLVRISQEATWKDKTKLDPASGLALCQLGNNKKMYYLLIPLENKDNTATTFLEYALINPKITAKSSKVAVLKNGEGCFSDTKKHDGLVPRSYKIQVIGYDYLQQKTVNLVARGYEAIVFQHLQDHLESKSYYYHINKTNPWFKDPEWIII